MYPYILTLHILAATIWTGGHIVLSTTILPEVLKTRQINTLLNFEQRYEKIGMPALIIQVITGLYLVYTLVPNLTLWLSFSSAITVKIGIKLILLLSTVLLALNARFRIVPRLSNRNLNIFAVHIILVTAISIAFVLTGISFKIPLF